MLRTTALRTILIVIAAVPVSAMLASPSVALGTVVDRVTDGVTLVGHVDVPSGRSRAVVPLDADIVPATVVTATVHRSRPGASVSVISVRKAPGADMFTVRLSGKAPTSGVRVDWAATGLVVAQPTRCDVTTPGPCVVPVIPGA
jgi:hypothetical protein